MKRFIYIMETGKMLHVGITSDVFKTIEFYDGLLHLTWPPAKFNRLVYLEDNHNEEIAILRLQELMSMPNNYKRQIIENVNPEMLDITKEMLINQGWN